MAERFANVETMVEFVKKYTPCINGETTMECVERSIRKAPTIEAKLVVHAHWEEQNDGTHFCSRCGNDATYTYEGKELVGFFCPFCGAQMDEEVVEENATTTGVKILVISMEDVPKIMEEMPITNLDAQTKDLGMAGIIKEMEK